MGVSTYREWADAARTPAVRCWWEQRIAPGGPGHVQRVVPDGCADIIVGDHDAVLVGPNMSVATPWLPPGARWRGLRFRTEAIGPALRHPAADLHGRTLPLAALMSDRQARRVADQVAAGVLPRFVAEAVVDPRVRAAVRQLSRPAPMSYARVCDELGSSPRHLRRLLVEHTGLGPSAIQRVARLQAFLRLAGDTWPAPPLAELAFAAGYADQPHLSRDVRGLTGVTPAALLRERLAA